TETGRLLWQASQDNWLGNVIYTHRGRRLLTQAGWRLRFFDTESGRELGPTLMTPAQFGQFRVTENGSRIVAASEENFVGIFDGVSGESLVEPISSDKVIVALEIDHDGKRFATGAVDGSVSVYDMETGRSLTSLLWHNETTGGQSSVQIRHLRFLPNGRQLLSTASDGSARLWDLEPSEPAPTWLTSLAEAVGGLRVNNSTNLMLSSAIQLTAVPYKESEAARAQLAALPPTNGWNQLPRWFFAPPEKRAATPLQQRD
ncbi:MAG TPA: hypothetical protein VI282_10790, partial [Verrucomicrobiae bacterium]